MSEEISPDLVERMAAFVREVAGGELGSYKIEAMVLAAELPEPVVSDPNGSELTSA